MVLDSLGPKMSSCVVTTFIIAINRYHPKDHSPQEGAIIPVTAITPRTATTRAHVISNVILVHKFVTILCYLNKSICYYSIYKNISRNITTRMSARHFLL